MNPLVHDLAQSALELIETHISWVFLFADEVFKVKKPVDFGFLDFRDPAARLQACQAEVALNRRLAPDVYLGVVPVTRAADGRHQFGGSGPALDHAVHMRRLPEADRADVRLEAGRLGAAELQSLAERLARFHAESARGPTIDAYGEVELIARNVRENFAQAHASLSELVSEAQQAEVEAWQLGFLERRSELFRQRIAAGKIRDGHGDLRLEHVYIDDRGQPTIIDCIEFNERFRYADVCADVAFLSMDLAWHGRVDLKEAFLAAYARASDDYDLYALVDFYESYRAYVRAKIAAFGYTAPGVPFERQKRLEEQARRYFLLSLASERPPLAPRRLLAVGGVLASGKSTLARAIGAELGLPVISSDRTRKALLGIGATEPRADAAFAAGYSEQMTERVYAEVLRRAAVVLESGRSVIVDATFRTRAQRASVRECARRLGVEFVFLECRAPDAVSRARLAARARGPSESDGRLEIFDDFLARYEPVQELPGSEHVVVDTGGALEQSLATLRERGLLAR